MFIATLIIFYYNLLHLAHTYPLLTPSSSDWQGGSNFEESFEEETSSSSDNWQYPVYNRGTMPTRHMTRPPTKPQRLLPPDEVVAQHIKLKNPSTMPRLSVKLARQSFFGTETMLKSTVYGQRGYGGLPEVQLTNLKLFLVQLFPLLNKAEFEDKWKECLTSIGQACKTMRSNYYKHQQY